MFANPRYGTIGTVGMPYFAIFEFLSPVFALGGVLLTILLFALGEISGAYFVAFLVVSVGLGVLLTTAALAIEEFGYGRYRRRREVVRLLAYAVLENIGYRLLHDVWRAIGYIDIARGTTTWGAQQRRGFDVAPKAPDGESVSTRP